MWFDLSNMGGSVSVWMEPAFPGGYSGSSPYPYYIWDSLGIALNRIAGAVYLTPKVNEYIIIGNVNSLSRFLHHEDGTKDVLPSWSTQQGWHIWSSIEEHSRLYVEGYI